MKLVFTSGCWDIIHAGHVQFLERARSLGDCLIVGINTDYSVSCLKGETRPVNRLADRMAVLRAVRWVDVVLPFSELTPVRLVASIRPDVLVKGPGYSVANMPEARVAEAWGAEVVILDGPPISTTTILERLHA